MNELIDKLGLSFGTYLPTLLLALAVLVIGWLVARIAGSVVRRTLRRTDLDNRIVSWLFAGKEKPDGFAVEAWAGKGVFYVLMLFVLVAFFQVLGLSTVTEPLNRFLVEIFEFAPRLLGPAVLVLVAWIVASVLRYVIRQVLDNVRLDERLADTADREESLPLSQTLSEAAYWLVFLLFLPAILGPLGLDGLLTPVQNLVDQLLGFLPQLLAAGLILAVGWFVARIVQRIVTSLMAAVGVDGFSEQVGLAPALGKQKLSGLLGTLLYVLILIPVLIASLDALAVESITQPASQMLNTLLGALPNIFAAILVIAIAFFVGKIVAGLTSNLLQALGFDLVLERIGLRIQPAKDGRTPAQIVGTLVLVAVMLFAATEAARLLGFEVVGSLVAQFMQFGGRIVLGLIILGIGLFLANLAARTVRASSASQAGLLSFLARVAIIILTSAMALRQMGLANEIVNLAFGLTVGAIAVALALAFGLGARDAAARQVEDWRDQLKGKTKDR